MKLQEGDVLLYSSSSWIGWLIKKLDGTDVTHAGVYLGDGQVGEALIATNAGINANPLSQSINGSDWVDAYRLKQVPPTLDPVIDIANRYISDGNRYAYGEIMLVAVVCSTRRVNLTNPWLRRIVMAALKKANDWIEKAFDKGREPMICSEFVYRCYDEAAPGAPDPYSIEIVSQGSGRPLTHTSPRRTEYTMLGAELVDALPTVAPESLLGQAMKSSVGELETFSTLGSSQPDRDIPSDDEFDAMVREYSESTDLESLPPMNAAPESQEQLDSQVLRFADNLVREHQLRFTTSSWASASPMTRLSATIADFVTPGDLLKSPSFVRVGRVS